MSHLRQSTAFSCRGLVLGLALAAATARAHDILSFDPNAKPDFPIDANTVLGTAPAPGVTQGLVYVRLRPNDLEIDLHVADGFAYKLLDFDPYHAPPLGTGAEIPSPVVDDSSGLPMVHDPHFDADKLLLGKRGESLFVITSNGTMLAPLAVAVDLTETQDVVFHITYPRPAPGPLRAAITYTSQLPTGQREVVTVLDGADHAIASASVGANTPYLDVNVPAPGAAATLGVATPPPPAKSVNPLVLIAGIAAGLAVLFCGLKFLRRPDRG